DRLLNFRRCPPSGSYRASIRRCYVAVGVHYLVRECHEVAGARASVVWDEHSTGGFKNRDAHHLTAAKNNLLRRGPPGICRGGPASSFCRNVILSAAPAHKTRISRWRESKNCSDSRRGGKDDGAPDPDLSHG